MEGVIIRSRSGFYDVAAPEGEYRCRARGRLRLEGTAPLVGDRVQLEPAGDGSGVVTALLPRKNAFIRPAVANVELLVILCANVNPVTDPFLMDQVAAIAAAADCAVAVCVNKCDLDPGDALYAAYQAAGYPTLRTSARTGEGVEALRQLISGRTCAFTGNSGVGKSSLLNALSPGLGIQVGEVSRKLGRGRHTTRHVELYPLGGHTYIADTPGFAAFDVQQMPGLTRENLAWAFPEFRPYLGQCRFPDCAHVCEPDCRVLEAVAAGDIPKSRHASYVRLKGILDAIPDWERRRSGQG